MSWTTWALLGFAVGWLLHAAVFGRGSWSSPGQQPRPIWPPGGPQPRVNWLRIIAGVFGVLGALFILWIAVSYEFFLKTEFWVEEAIARYRPAWPLLWVCAGWGTRDHREAIGNRFQELFDAFLGKRHEKPWALQAALAVFILFGILIAVRPELLDKIISFRAGDVEVKLGSSSAKLRENITLRHPSLVDSITRYENFDLFDKTQTKTT